MRQVVDETNRYAVADHVDIRGELGAGRVLHAQVRPPGIYRGEPRLRIVRLDVLFQLKAHGGEIAGFDYHLLCQFALNGKSPLERVTGSLIQVDSGLLGLSWSYDRGSKDIESVGLGNEVVAGRPLAQVVGAAQCKRKEVVVVGKIMVNTLA